MHIKKETEEGAEIKGTEMICKTWQCITMGRKWTEKICSEQDQTCKVWHSLGTSTAHQQSRNELRIERNALAEPAV